MYIKVYFSVLPEVNYALGKINELTHASMGVLQCLVTLIYFSDGLKVLVVFPATLPRNNLHLEENLPL